MSNAHARKRGGGGGGGGPQQAAWARVRIELSCIEFSCGYFERCSSMLLRETVMMLLKIG